MTVIIIYAKINRDIFVQPLIEKVKKLLNTGLKKGIIEVS